MQNKKLNLANQIWEIVYPVLMYYAAISIGTFIAQMFFGTGNESYMLCKIIGSLVAIPVVWADYKRDRMLSGEYGLKTPMTSESWINILFVSGITICLSVSLNNIISMSPLVTASVEYQNASDAFYGSSIGVELFGSALITPFLEELLHRGVVLGRLRKRLGMGMWISILMSAFIFAGLHFNIVQFIYAFLLGVVFALFVEKSGHIYFAILAHVLANGIAVVRTETGWLAITVDGTVSAWLTSIGLLLVGLGVLIIYMGRKITTR